MTERLLNREQVAALLGTTRDRAALILSKQGCHPIYLGRVPGGAPRWLESAVVAAIRELYDEAQPTPPKPKKPRIARPGNGLNLARMTANELDALLTRSAQLQ